MRILLDTHAFIWLDADRQKLSKTAAEAFQDPANDIYLSIVSIWEMQIKAQLGRLALRSPLPELVRSQLATNGIQLLSIEPDHVYELANLPTHHNDPFDRMLVAQAMTEQLVLMSNDNQLESYSASLLW